MSIIKRYASVLILLLPLSFAGPSGLLGQEPPATPPTTTTPPALEISEERLRSYVSAFLQVYRIMDEMNPELAAVRNKTNEAQELLREQRRERIHAVYAEHEMTEEEYNWIQFVISIDQERRETFERLLAEARTGGEP